MITSNIFFAAAVLEYTMFYFLEHRTQFCSVFTVIQSWFNNSNMIIASLCQHESE